MLFRSLRSLWFLSLVGSSASLYGQVPREPVHTEMVEKIKEEGMKRSRAMETVSYLTDVYGPRLTGSPLTRQAGEWAARTLEAWGLENAHLEPWGPFGRGWTLEAFTANMVAPNFSPLIGFPKAWSPSTPKVVRGKPILLHAQNEQELDQYRGKLHKALVLVSPPREVKALFDAPARRQNDETLLTLSNSSGSYLGFQSTSSGRTGGAAANPPGQRSPSSGAARPGPSGSPSGLREAARLQSRKFQLACEDGAAVILESGRGDGGTVFVGAASSSPTSSRSPQGGSSSKSPSVWAKDAPELIPQVVLAVEHYQRIIRMLDKDVPVELEIDIASRYQDADLMSFNVIAEIPGSDLREEVVMLGAHLDSWHSGTGATDNAVGCAVALEAVRILKAIDAKPRRTIRVALWTGEEQGLLGSKAYVAEHFGRVVPPTSSSGPKDAGPSQAASTARESGNAKSEGAGPATSREGEQPEKKPAGSAPRQPPPARYELKPDHESLAGYFNLDNGTGRIRGIFLQNNEAIRPVFRAWLGPFAELGASTISLANTGGTDHLSFDALGLPGFQFIQDPVEYDTRTHHSSMDVYDRIQEDDVKQASVIMASFVYHAAMRDEKLPRKPVPGEIVRLAETP